MSEETSISDPKEGGFSAADVERMQEKEKKRREEKKAKGGEERWKRRKKGKKVRWFKKRQEEINFKRKNAPKDKSKPLPPGNYSSGQRPKNPESVEIDDND